MFFPPQARLRQDNLQARAFDVCQALALRRNSYHPAMHRDRFLGNGQNGYAMWLGHGLTGLTIVFGRLLINEKNLLCLGRRPALG